MEKVLEVYKRRYDRHHPVVWMDESPKQLIKETRTAIGASPGRCLRYDYEYTRRGVCNVFMASEPLVGRRLTKVTARRTKRDWALFIEELAAEYANAQRITLVMDNLNTHQAGSLYETFEPKKAKALWDRFEFVYTPKHGSWLNIAENELSSMTRQCLHGRRIGELPILQEEIGAWSLDVTSTQRGVDWQMKIDDARSKLKSVYPNILV